jgi:hypothetical protein
MIAPITVFEPHAIFSLEQVQKGLGLKKSTVSREVRMGRLRVARRGGKYFFLGSWITSWIEKGELPVRMPGTPVERPDDDQAEA